MQAEINKEFIFNYLSGNASALQKQMVDEWVKVPAQEELFYQWLVEFEYQHPQYISRLPEAIERFHHYAEQWDTNPVLPENSEQSVQPHRRLRWGWLVAACLLLGILAAGTQLADRLQYKTYASAYGETRTVLLSDSTRVVLNANSQLRVPRFGFGKSSRKVTLTGEASFDVTHQPNHQKFVVSTTKGVEVVVLGTEFTVYSRHQKDRVVLNRGKVQLRYQEGNVQKQLLMKPGELVTLDGGNRAVKETTRQPDNYAAWKEHRFVFDDTTLREFAELMQENYGIRITLENDSLANRTLVGSFRADSPEELLDIVTKLFDVRLVKSGDTLLLTR